MTPDASRDRAAAGASCGPEDVVLVKASRAAGLERVALADASAEPVGASAR